jgi:hypothetical protein
VAAYETPEWSVEDFSRDRFLTSPASPKSWQVQFPSAQMTLEVAIKVRLSFGQRCKAMRHSCLSGNTPKNHNISQRVPV